jgi:FtsH-binding integral membrane protein
MSQPEFRKLDDEEFEIETRLGFVRKVYGILSAQLVFTAGVCYMPFYSVAMKDLFNNIALLITMSVLSIVLICALGCSKSLARKVPINYILLGLFTFCESWIVASLCSLYDPKLVVMAAFMTAGLVISLTVYACTTKTDFTLCGASLFILFACLIMFGIFAFLFADRIMYDIYCCLGVALFGVYLVFDTQMIMGGKTHQISMDDYVFAAIMLYIDILQLFIFILKFLGNR